MKRRVLLILLLILLVIAGGVLTGFFVTPNVLTESRLIEVPSYDVLKWQADKESEIIQDYQAGDYSQDHPYIIVDPYQMNPLSALVIFNATQDDDYKMTVQGDQLYSTLNYIYHGHKGRVEIPVLGLYANRSNKITIESSSTISELDIQTEDLPTDFQNYRLVESKPMQMERGFTLMIACFSHSYTAVIDQNGDVRGYLSNIDMAHGTSIIQLKNGNLMATGDEYKQLPYNMTSLWEFNWLGKIFREYEIPNAVHHDISEMPNGDILAVSNNRNMFTSGTREDVVIVVDRKTGGVKKEYDFRKIIDEKRAPFHNFHPDILNTANIDWMHTNSAVYDQEHGWIIVSSPTQSQVVCIDQETSKIIWILGPHEGYEGSSQFLKQYLLTPIGDDFEWQWTQHHPMILSNQDNDPDTMDILLFDNGQSKSYAESGAVLPENNTSRAVQYRIDLADKTVEQIWAYGQTRGNEFYSTFLGDADALKYTDNRLIAFGGHLTQNGKTVDRIVDGVFGKLNVTSRVVEVTRQNEVVFEVAIENRGGSTAAETYQAERIDFFSPLSFESVLGEQAGSRIGEPYFVEETDSQKPPNFYIGQLSAHFNQLKREENRLIVDGELQFQERSYVLGQALVVLRSSTNAAVYPCNSGLNGRFFASIDLSSLPPGLYEISVMGGVKEGNDVLSGKMHRGYFPTGYKVTIE